MKKPIANFLNSVLLAGILTAPLAFAPLALQAQERKTFHDRQHNDDHQWNDHEDKAYRMYAKENHRKYVPFAKLKEEDQQSYWGWRHEHSDAQLKIVIR